jgi:predicted DnaQ family exonuclease/DinG family helicase
MKKEERRPSQAHGELADWLDGLGLSEFVALDLETTGLDSTTCEIISSLTGITDDDLAHAPDFVHVADDLTAFLNQSPLVGQNVDFDLGFLRASFAATLKRRRAADLDRRYTLDTAMLGRVFWPELPSFGLSSLCEYFEIPQACAHRAADDALSAGRVLAEMVRRLPGRVWSELAERLDALIVNSGHRSRFFFRALCTLASNIAKPKREPESKAQEIANAFTESPAALLGDSGPFVSKLPFFHVRRAQVEMAAAVLDSFEQNRVLLAEAPTGVGKSLAYLVPALCWIAQDGDARRQVIVSSHTKLLQEQLFRKDVEAISQAANRVLHAAVLKGRNNYLCKRRLRLLLREADDRLSDLDRVQLMPLLRWAELTRTGDIAEINGFSPRHQPYLWAQVASDGLACAGSLCGAAKGDFHRLAQDRAARAQLVFVNHALLLSDMPRFIGSDKRLVLDEAHQIERAVVAAMTTETSFPVLRGCLTRLADERAPRGLLATVETRAGVDTTELSASVRTLHGSTRQAFAALAERLALMLGATERSGRRRFRRGDRLHSLVSETMSGLLEEWNGFCQVLIPLVRELGDRRGDERVAPDLLSELRTLSDHANTLGQSLTRMSGEDLANEVRWVEFGRTNHGTWCSLLSGPVSVGKIMETSFWPAVRSAVLTSATLSAAGNFTVLRESLGLTGSELSEVVELTLDGPINFGAQMRLFVPTDLPEPRVDECAHLDATAKLCCQVVEEIARGTLVLCTSNEQVEKITSALRPVARRQQRPLLSQSSSHALPELLAEFRRRKDAVLVGAASLWEGIDVVGEALQVLIVTRLPFDVPSDPWVSARCDALQQEGHDPFLEYSVPIATLRLRQGIGRLIRHPDDRGVAVIADPRLFTARYGRVIRAALPVEAVPAHTREEMLATMKTFLEIESA